MQGKDFRDRIKKLSRKEDKDLEELKKYQQDMEKYLKTQLNETYLEKDEEMQRYFYNLLGSLLLDYKRNFPNCDIQILSRFKSDESYVNKIKERAENGKFDKKITDAFAMKIIINSADLNLSENDVLKERIKKDNEIYSNMSSFLNLMNENLGEENSEETNIKRIDYYRNIRTILASILELVPGDKTAGEAQTLRGYYEEKLTMVDKIIEVENNNENNDFYKSPYLSKKALYNLGIDAGDMENNSKKKDFEVLLSTFNAMIYDEFYYSTITSQVDTLLRDPKKGQLVHKMLGRKEDNIVEERPKITDTGYMSKFIKLRTLYGVIELQLQTAHQFKEGVSGFASHMGYKFSVPTPTPKDMNDERQIESFRNRIKYRTPIYADARYEPRYSVDTASVTVLDKFSALK